MGEREEARMTPREFPGGPELSPPVPGFGQGTFKIPHVSGQLSPCTTAREATTPRTHAP